MSMKYNGTKELLVEFIDELGVKGEWSENQQGNRFKTSDGGILMWYNTGTILLQGQGNSISMIRKELPNIHLHKAIAIKQEVEVPVIKGELFVVYGHDRNSRDQLELMLHKMEIEPVILASTNSNGLTIIESLEKRIGQNGTAVAAIILLTPDDTGYANNIGTAGAKLRARQNVILEMGMVLGKLGRKNTIMIKKGDLEVPSDADGIIYLAYQNHVNETIVGLVERLEACGFNINHRKALNAGK